MIYGKASRNRSSIIASEFHDESAYKSLAERLDKNR